MNRDDYRHLLLAGTVTFPATFPQLGSLTLVSERMPGNGQLETRQTQDVLVVCEFPSARVTIKRKVFADKVRAVFLPQDPNRVSYACGTWLLAEEIATYLRCRERALGIVFVAETEPTQLEVRAGMTAAESAQYYPPLPNDRSYNHYGGQQKPRNMMSCDACDTTLAPASVTQTSEFRSLAAESLTAQRSFSCDSQDEMCWELCSCDGDDPIS